MSDINRRLAAEAGKLTDPKITYGETHFSVRKMSAWDGFHVLEELRAGIAEAAAKIPHDGGMEAMIGAGITAMPRETVRRGADLLFGHVDFRNAQRGVAIPVAGNEDEAFDGLEPVHVYLVLARAFAVNFTQSWSEIASLLAGQGRDTKPGNT